jgi:ComF family protein
VTRLADALVSVLIAPSCACCGQPLRTPTSGAACDGCWASVPSATGPLCDICGDALRSWRADNNRRCGRCRRARRIISSGRSIGPYEGALRDIIQALKYDKRRSLARPLAERMARSGAEVLEGADALVPVPLHFMREWRRGFNQAAEIARHIGVPVLDCLRRRRATITQTDLPEAQRHANVRGAFTVRRPVPAGAILVVVDDVSTTGATLDACALALLDAGAREVRGLTAARAAARLP